MALLSTIFTVGGYFSRLSPISCTVTLLATESRSKTAYIKWKHPCICTITNVLLFRESFLLSAAHFTRDFDTLKRSRSAVFLRSKVSVLACH